VLAQTPAQLAERVRELVRDPAARDALGAEAQRRAREFTWERTAAANLAVLAEAAERGHRRLRDRIRARVRSAAATS
jgi:D-inositol-3-phosphate glycosyltransferase